MIIGETPGGSLYSLLMPVIGVSRRRGKKQRLGVETLIPSPNTLSYAEAEPEDWSWVVHFIPALMRSAKRPNSATAFITVRSSRSLSTFAL